MYTSTEYLPSALQDEFEHLLYKLVEDARDWRPLVIAGDFKALPSNWGSRETNRPGKIFFEVTAAFQLSTRIGSSLVSDLYTCSDHRNIVFEIAVP